MILPGDYTAGMVIRSRRDQVQYDRNGRAHIIEKGALAIILGDTYETSSATYLQVLSGGNVWSIDISLVHAAWSKV